MRTLCLAFLAKALLLAGTAAPLAAAPLYDQEPDRSVAAALAPGHGATILSQAARLHVTDRPLEQALIRLQQTSGIPLAYSPTLLPVGRVVTCRCTDATVEEAIATLLHGMQLDFRVLADQLVITQKTPSAYLVAAAQPSPRSLGVAADESTGTGRAGPEAEVALQGAITGRIVDAQTREPLSGVQVHVTGTSLGALTNAAGRYLLTNIPTGTVTVRAELLGYRATEQTVQVTEGGTATANFELGLTQIGLEELIVSVEASEMRRRELGTDVSVVNVERALAQGAVNSLSGLLQARAAGVSVVSGSGLVGHGSRIRVRGPTSLTQDNHPLIVIDGVRVSNNTTFGTSATDGGGTSRFDDLNPNEIESMQVVKGPAATALYGSEAAPGVIVIRTKRGIAGDPLFTFSARYGVIDNPWSYPDNYANVTEVYGVTSLDDPRIAQFRAEQNPVTGDIFLTHNPFENPATTPFEQGSLGNVGARVTGGNDDLSYLVSGDYSSQQGVVNANFYDRLNLRANTDFAATDELTIGAHVGLVDSERGYPQDNSTGSGMGVNGFLGSPIAAFGSDGVCARDALLGVPDGTTGWCHGREGNFGMPFQTILNLVDNGEAVFRTTGSVVGEWIPEDWFTNRVTVGFDRTERDRWTRWLFDPTGISRQEEGSFDERRYTTRMLTADYTGTLTGDVGQSIRRWTTFGAQYFAIRNEWITCSGEDYPNDDVRGCGQGFFSSGTSGLSEQKEVGAFLQQRFGYNDYFFLTGAIRVDDNASLGDNVDAIWSPSFNASLVVSDMPFWNLDLVDNLRLRTAWGTASQSPEPYAADRTFASAPVTLGGRVVGGITPQSPGNPELGPERSEELEVGLDASLLADRIGLTFTYYDIKVRDLIVPRPVAPSVGFPGAQLVNLGLMENKGYELSLSMDVIQRRNFSWNVAFNHSHFDPVITDLGLEAPIFFPTGADGGSRAAGSQVFATGFAPGAYNSCVVNSATRDASGSITSFELAPGNLTEGSCRRVVGSPWPDAEQSLSTSFTLLQNLTITALFDRVAGADMLNVTRAFRTPFIDNPGFGAYGREYALRQTFSPEHQAMIEQAFYAAFLESGDYVKFRELNVSYSVPPRLTSGIGVSSARITVAGRNLHTWTDFSILDPEMDVQGSRDNFIRNNFAGSFPPLRNVWVGVTVTP